MCIRDRDHVAPAHRIYSPLRLSLIHIWSTVVALSGFLYDGVEAAVVAAPKIPADHFRCFWATGTGWGTYSLSQQRGNTVFAIEILAGTLACRSCEIAAPGTTAAVQYAGRPVVNRVERHQERATVLLGETLRLAAKDQLRIEVRA